MKEIITLFIVLWLHIFSNTSWAQTCFSSSLCNNINYLCIKIASNDTWETLFPDPHDRDLVQRINRMNIALQQGMQIAVPKNLEKLDLYKISPFPLQISADGTKIIYISQKKLAWGAYDGVGKLVRWGPISSGMASCADDACLTPVGVFNVMSKQDEYCVSTTFPKRLNADNGGAKMPFCMYFFHGYALHGSHHVPGYPASHGCVRLFVEDARWLNESFVDLPGGGVQGTLVVLDF